MSRRRQIILSLVLAAATVSLTACASGKTKMLVASETTPAPSPSVAAAPTSTPTATAKPDTSGKITIAQLLAGKVQIPKWTLAMCPSGLQKIHQGGTEVNHDSNLELLHVYRVAYTNLDADADDETAALITCQAGEAATGQIIAFDRDSAGRIVTLGSVAHGIFWSLKARAGDGVTVNISDSESCCSTPKAFELHQIRSYAWRSGHFVQVAGPESFVPHTQKIDIRVTVMSVTWSARTNKTRTGTVMLKIANNSGYHSGDILIYSSDDPSGFSATWKISGIAARGSVTKTIKIVAADDGYYYGTPSVSVTERGAYSIGGDLNDINNWASVPRW